MLSSWPNSAPAPGPVGSLAPRSSSSFRAPYPELVIRRGRIALDHSSLVLRNSSSMEYRFVSRSCTFATTRMQSVKSRGGFFIGNAHIEGDSAVSPDFAVHAWPRD